VQRILNALPGTLIWGEHAGMLDKLADLYYFAKDNPSLHEYSYSETQTYKNRFDTDAYKDAKKWQAWSNWFLPTDLPDIFRHTIEQFFVPQFLKGIDTWGFKEIRYSGFSPALKLLLELYPNATFIIIIRDPLNTIESQISTFHKGRSRYPRLKRLLSLGLITRLAKDWRELNNSFIELAAANPGVVKLLRYEDVVEDPEILNAPLARHGLRIGSTQKQVIAEAEGRGTGYKNRDSTHERWRSLGLIPAFIAEFFVGSTAKKAQYSRPNVLKGATWLSRLFDKRTAAENEP
jgi:hypothetical protein